MRKLISAVLAVLFMAVVHLVIAEERPLPQANVEQIERLITTYMAAHSVPGLSIALVVDSKPIWSNGYGMADLENYVPAKASTVYRTASIGKTMTATAAMQLVEEGKLDLDTDVQQYCPAFPRKAQKITPRLLLSHLGGIRHYGGPHDKEEQSSTIHYDDVVDALAPFKDDPLLFEPGTRFLYSSYGYDVLGCVIEGAAGVPFLKFMKEHIWGPVDMGATRNDDPSSIIPNRAAGYAFIDGKPKNAQHVDMSNRLPAGGYVTTAIDLARFASALMTGRLVRTETFARMITPATLKSGEKVPYGFGWAMELEEWHSDTWVFHGGSSPGASGFVALMPRHKFAVVFLTNMEDLPDRGELAESIARIALGFVSAETQH